MSPMAPDDLLLKAGLLTPGSKVASGMASAAPNIQQPAQDSGGWGPAPPDLLQRAQTGRFMVGGPDSRMAMFPDEFPESKTDKPNVVMRGVRGIAAGIADMAPSTMALAASVIDFMGADEAGAKLGQKALDVSSWLNDHLAVENPNLYDHAMRGVGSMLTFILPGIGAAAAAGKIATAAGMAGKAATTFRALTGGGAMSFLEAAVEQSQREMELIGKGMTPEQAMKESAPVFWHNMGVLMATNTVAYFLPLPIKTKNEFVRRAAKAVEAAFTEGGQERAQAVIQAVASGEGEWGDFLDPKKNVTDTLVGALVGGGTAALLPGEPDAPQNVPAAPVANAPAQTPQTPPAAASPQQAPAQASQPAQTVPPPSAPAAPIPVPTDLPMEPVEGWDVWTGQEQDEEPGLTRTPAQMEAEQVAAVEPPSAPVAEPIPETVNAAPEPDISPEAPAPLRKVASEAKRRAAERKAAAQAEAAAVNAEAQRRMEAAKPAEPEPVPVRDKNAVVNPEYADPAAAEDVAEYERRVERTRAQIEEKKRGEYAGGHTMQELQSRLKGEGFEFAAARRRLTGDLTEIERKAEDKRRASNYVGKPVSIRRPDGTAINGKIVGTPFGRVSVELETGEKITVDKENIGSPIKTTTPVTEAKQEAPTAAAVNVVAMPRDQLTVDPTVFQARKNVTNPESGTNEPKMKRIMAKFKASKLKAIVAWRDPADGKLKVLDGHHTLEAAKRGGVDVVDVTIFKGTREEAIQESKNLNDESDANDPLARAGNLRNMRESGETPESIQGEATRLYGKDAPTITALSYLNPDGAVMAALEQFMGADTNSDSNDSLMKIAKYVGEARRRNPNLTDAHEQEMFDTLRQQFGKVKWASTEADFLKHVRGLATAEDFDPAGRLNLTLDKRTAAEKDYDAEIEAAQKALWDAETALYDKKNEMAGNQPVADKNGNPVLIKSGPNKGRKSYAKPVGAKPVADEIQAGIIDKLKAEIKFADDTLKDVIGRKARFVETRNDQGGLFRLARPSLASLNKSAAARGLSPAVTQQPRDLMDEIVVRVAKMFGFKNVQFVSGLTTTDGRMAHGYYQPESDTVFLNVGSQEPMLTVLMHEVGHRMEVEHPDLYGQLIQILNDPANVRTGGKEVYGKDAVARGYGNVGIEREWVSDGLMEASSRPEFWNVLQEKNPTLAGKLIQMIVDAMNAIRKMFSASGASVDIYYNNFGPLVRQIANVAAQMQAREAEVARASRPASAQQSMFRVGGRLRKIATWFTGTGTLEAVLPGAAGVHAVEYTPEIIAQYNKAYGTNYTARDVNEIDPMEVAATGADHFHASPVCKNFSKAKRSRQSGDTDIASAKAVVGVIMRAGMPSITIENVVDYIGTEPYKMITEALTAAGYTWDVVKHNATDFGAAQTRKRMMIRAVKDGNLPPVPEKVEAGDWFDAISDLIDAAPASQLPPWESERIERMKERGELDGDLPIITMGGSTDKIRALAANSGGPAPTLKATEREVPRIVMPDGRVVKVTPRMMARLMGLPDTFDVPEHYGFAKKVLGNGIHGKVTEALVAPLVNGERGTSPVSEETAGQIDMFRIAPIGNPLANEMRDKQDVAMKASNQPMHSGWKAGWRHVYMMMVDKHTFTHVMVRDIVKMANPKLAKGFSLLKDPYLALRRFGTWMTAVEVALKHGIYSWDNQTILSIGLEQIIKKHGLSDAIDSREFGMFYTAATLVSRKYSLASRGKDFFGTDPTSDEYQAAEAEFLKWQQIYDDYRKAHPEWEDAAADFTKYAYALIQRSYEAGVINEREFIDLTKTYSTYAPLFVIDSSKYDVDRGDPIGAGTAAHEMTRFDPTAVRMDPIDALIKQTYHMEFFTRRNEAARKHGDFIRTYRDRARKGVTVLEGFGMRVKPKEDPVVKRVQQLLEAAGLSQAEIAALGRTPEQLEREAKLYVTSRVQPDGVIALLRDGEVEYWQLEPDIYESFMAATGPKAMHPMMKFFSAQTSLLRSGAVLTPDFMARNQWRDIASASIISQHLIRNPIDPFLVPVRILRGLSHAIKKDDVYLEFMLEAGHAQLTAQDQNGLRKSSEALTRDARGRAGRAGQAARNLPKYVIHSHPITILQEFGKLTENSSRIAVYEKTKADLLGMGWSEAEARVKAAMEARESSIDFARSGKYGQVINQIIPFFNAAVQGNDKAFRTFVVDSGGRGSAWLKATMLVTMPSVVLWALNHDDEWYKDQPIWLKNNFWLFSVDGGKTIHKLPKPFEIGLMYASLAERFLDWRVDKDPKAMKEWSEAVLKNVVAINEKNPIASAGQLVGPMVGTMTEIVSNYDSFRGTPIVKGWLEEVVPREQYNASTSEFAKVMGGMAPGRGISPMMIDHFIRGSFGGLGAYAAQAASEVIMLARPELKAMRPSDKQVRTLVGAEVPDWIPVIRAFASASPSGYTRQMNDFFEIYDRGREASKTLQAFKASGAPRDKFISLYRRSGADIATFKASQDVAEKLGALSKRARFIESMPSDQMSRDEKRRQIDELTESRNLMVKKFLERYYQVDQRELQRQIEASIPQLERGYGR